MEKIISIGIIGFGGMGEHHANLLALNPCFRVGGVYDIAPSACQRAERLGLKAFESVNKLFDAVDAVVIATPNDSHCEYTLLAAKCGRHIICEKPVTLTLNDANAMFDAAEQNNVVFYVHQNRRWDKDYLTAMSVVNSGDIGEVYRIESRVMGSHGIPGGWRKLAACGGGMIFDWGVHLIDQIVCAYPEKIIGLYCQPSYIFGHEVDDGFNLTIDFEHGLCVNIVVDTNTFIPLPRWQIYGLNGTACINNWDSACEIVKVVNRKDPHLKPIQAGNGLTKTMSDRSAASVETSKLALSQTNPQDFYNAFYNSVVLGAETIIKRPQIERVIKIMHSAFTSIKTHQYQKTNL